MPKTVINERFLRQKALDFASMRYYNRIAKFTKEAKGLQRKLFDEIEIDFTEDEPHRMKLTYYLLTDSVREEYCDLKVYGAEIDKEDVFSGGICENESKIIKNLFFRLSEAEDFLEKLVVAKVTPMGLMSAVSEHVSEKIKQLIYEE